MYIIEGNLEQERLLVSSFDRVGGFAKMTELGFHCTPDLEEVKVKFKNEEFGLLEVKIPVCDFL